MLWQGSIGSHGYGDFRWRNKAHCVHRFIFEYYNGPLQPGEMALHKCDTRACGRIDHLFRGTAKTNTHDMMAKGRQRFEGMKLMQTPGVPHR